MAHFVAFLKMEKPELNETYRQEHLDYLAALDGKGKIFAKGPFTDGSGGMVIYIADSYEEAEELAKADPYIIKGVRSLVLREWVLKI